MYFQKFDGSGPKLLVLTCRMRRSNGVLYFPRVEGKTKYQSARNSYPSRNILEMKCLTSGELSQYAPNDFPISFQRGERADE